MTTTTPFSCIYDRFLSMITDDMYMELTELDTFRLLHELLMSALPDFEFPRVNIFDYEDEYVEEESTYCGVDSNYEEVKTLIYGGGCFNCYLTVEEMDIIAIYMIVEWIGQQLASVENTRMKYSGSDFKFTSQANHMTKLLTIKKGYEEKGFHRQRLYKRRKISDEGKILSTMSVIMEVDGE